MKRKKIPKLNKKNMKIDLLGKALELPSSAVCKDGKTEIIGNREATVDGCRCVVEYNENKITLNVGNGNITFNGSDLEIATLNDSVATIRGLIVSAEFRI